MNTQSSHKIIKNKLGLLNLAQTLGSVSKACKTMGFSRDSYYCVISCNAPPNRIRGRHQFACNVHKFVIYICHCFT